jgi:hypothetical protein
LWLTKARHAPVRGLDDGRAVRLVGEELDAHRVRALGKGGVLAPLPLAVGPAGVHHVLVVDIQAPAAHARTHARTHTAPDRRGRGFRCRWAGAPSRAKIDLTRCWRSSRRSRGPSCRCSACLHRSGVRPGRIEPISGRRARTVEDGGEVGVGDARYILRGHTRGGSVSPEQSGSSKRAGGGAGTLSRLSLPEKSIEGTCNSGGVSHDEPRIPCSLSRYVCIYVLMYLCINVCIERGEGRGRKKREERDT